MKESILRWRAILHTMAVLYRSLLYACTKPMQHLHQSSAKTLTCPDQCTFPILAPIERAQDIQPGIVCSFKQFMLPLTIN